MDEDICGWDGKVINLFLTSRSGVQKGGLDLRSNSGSHQYLRDI